LGNKVTYKPFGDRAILIEWEAEICASISNTILAFQQKIGTFENRNIVDTIVGYTSLTIVYKMPIVDYLNEVAVLKKINTSKDIGLKKSSFTWEIPVCYDVEFGIDLQEISKVTNLEISEIMKLHSQNLYRIYFIGFLPGFLYLGGLNKQLFFNRKSNPRLKVAKGTVAIGGEQTGVYPSESAGGWNIIGKTPVNFFNINEDSPCFAKAGDFIKFVSIDKNEFLQIEREVKANAYQISKTLQND
jgi:inhibitor of KinA